MNNKFFGETDISINFITSTGRTGTKFFAQFLNDISNEIDARHEPKPDCMKLQCLYGIGRYSKEKAIREFIKKRSKLYREIQQSEKSIYIESNPYLNLLVPIIQEIFSDYKILHIVRDGRDWIRSTMNRKSWYSTPSALIPLYRFFPHPIHLPYSYLINPYILDAWHIRGTDFPEDPWFNKWSKMTRFQKLAWAWNKVDGLIHEAIKDDPNALTIQFESVFNKNQSFSTFKKIFHFFNMDYLWDIAKLKLRDQMNVKINKTVKHHFPQWNEWSEELKGSFDEIAEDRLKLYGYRW